MGGGKCTAKSVDSIPLDCFGSGCPLEHSTLVRAAMFHSSSPHVKAGRVAQLSPSAEAALEKFYFRYLVGNYGALVNLEANDHTQANIGRPSRLPAYPPTHQLPTYLPTYIHTCPPLPPQRLPTHCTDHTLAWYPGDPVRPGAQCTGPQCGAIEAASYVSGSGNGDHVRHSTAYLASQVH